MEATAPGVLPCHGCDDWEPCRDCKGHGVLVCTGTTARPMTDGEWAAHQAHLAQLEAEAGQALALVHTQP